MLAGGSEVAGAFFADAYEGVLVADGEVEGLPEVHFGAGEELHIVFVEGVVGGMKGDVAVGHEGLGIVEQAAIGEAYAKVVFEGVYVIDHGGYLDIVETVVHFNKVETGYVGAGGLGGVAAFL